MTSQPDTFDLNIESLNIDKLCNIEINLLTTTKTTFIKLDNSLNYTTMNLNETKLESDSADITQVSFLLTVFDNIVGPKIVHHWTTMPVPLEDHILKYVAIHTLNGELYQGINNLH